jgi:pilus assembly protein CpaD
MDRMAYSHRGCGAARCFLVMACLPALLVAPLAGCRDNDRLDDATALIVSDPEKRHPIHFSRRTETLHVEVPAGATGLSTEQEADVYRFVDRYKAESVGPLRVSAPILMSERVTVSRSLKDVRDLVRGAGIAPRSVIVGRHRAGPDANATVRLSYERAVTIPPECGDWSEDVGPNRERVPHPNFGCATHHNLAVMVDNPRDLLTPQAEDPRSAERRSLTWTGYTAAQSGSSSPSSSGGSADAKGKPAIK